MKNFLRSVLIFLALINTDLAYSGETLVFNPPTGGDFKVKSVNPKTLDTTSFRGRSILIVFGFTECKSVCPLTLGRLKSYYESLNQNDKNKPLVLFVSVDTVRDNLKKINDYVKAFNSDFVGATESDKNLKKILEGFGARYYRYKTKSGKLLVDHTSDIYIVNSKGVWADSIDFDSDPNAISAAVKKAETITSVEERFPQSTTAELITQKSCSLTNGTCDLSFNENRIKVELSSKNIKLQSPFKVLVSISSALPDALTPQFADLQGVELSMGLLRPKFRTLDNRTYEAEVTLPFCELKKMNWNMTLILKDKAGKNIAGKFKFVSRE